MPKLFDITNVQKQADTLEGWLKQSAPHVVKEQKHLDAGSEAQAYWNYGRLLALQDMIRHLSKL